MRRREFLAALLAAPTLTLIAGRTSSAQPLGEAMDLGDMLILAGSPTEHLLAVIEVRPDGTVQLELPRAEVGQGLTTAMAVLVAEELDVPLSVVTCTLAGARSELLFGQLTGSSNGVRSLYRPVRVAAATARARLVAAAASRWSVPRSEIVVADGILVGPAGRRLSIGEVAVDAADPLLLVPSAAPKSVDAQSKIGVPTSRIDARAMVTGSLEYAMDLDVPGAKPAVVRRPPSIGARVDTWDESSLLSMPGVLGAALVDTGIAVVAETFGQAFDAAAAAAVTWSAGTVDGESDATVRARLRAAVPETAVKVVDGDSVEGEFDFAFVSHAAMETNSAVADVRADRAEIWSSMQTPIVARQVIARELGLPVGSVVCHVVNAGGSFGRRLFFDAALEAAKISRAMGRPVRLMWSRVDDMRHGRVRSASYHRFGLSTAGGRVVSFRHDCVSVATDFSHGLGEMLSASVSTDGSGGSVFASTVANPYDFGASQEGLTEIDLGIATGSWRSVYSANSRGAAEIMVDRAALELGRDPVEFRLEHLQSQRHRDVVNAAARESNWGRSMPPGWAQGVGFHAEYRSSTAVVVDIDAEDPSAPRVRRAVVAVDVGRVVNPRGLEAQMLGGLTDAVSTTLRAGLHLLDGLPLEGSYSQFHYARQRDSPTEVRVVIIDGGGEPGGAGELGVPAAVGAVANAYARATGTAPSSFPIVFDVDFEPFPR